MQTNSFGAKAKLRVGSAEYEYFRLQALEEKGVGKINRLPISIRILLENLRPKGNRLEVEVTSLSANRIRDLDRRKVQWKIFHDINFVSLDYKPFDASQWPLREAGLLGPVVLRAATRLDPK